ATLARAVPSRFLWVGRSILGLAVLATALGLALGVSVGLIAAYTRSVLDDVLMRAMDVILAFPSIVLALVVVATIGPKLWLLVLVVGLTTTPRVARVTRGASLEIVERDFVQAAEVLGESRVKILFGEILPSITSPLMVEASLRLTYSIGLIAGLSFLGFGLQPPAADWGLMINENRQALTIQPWGAVMPAIASALLTIGLALLGHTRRGARIAGGEVRVDGKNVLAHSPRQLRALRGRTVSYVPQDPSAALNPALRIGRQLEETLAAHRFGANETERRE